MHLVRRANDWPKIFVVRDYKTHIRISGRAIWKGQKSPVITSSPSMTGLRHQQLGHYPIFCRLRTFRKTRAECHLQIWIIDDLTLPELQIHHREIHPGCWIRNVLNTQLSESVICRYEQIVPGNVCWAVKRRPVTRCRFSESIPLQLCLVVQSLPGSQGSAVQLQLFHLSRSTGKLTGRLLLPVAYAIPMEERNVSHWRPAVREFGIGFVSWHNWKCRCISVMQIYWYCAE